jgi:hypothetical protein
LQLKFALCLVRKFLGGNRQKSAIKKMLEARVGIAPTVGTGAIDFKGYYDALECIKTPVSPEESTILTQFEAVKRRPFRPLYRARPVVI